LVLVPTPGVGWGIPEKPLRYKQFRETAKKFTK
jgi:hypothetical protein